MVHREPTRTASPCGLSSVTVSEIWDSLEDLRWLPGSSSAVSRKRQQIQGSLVFPSAEVALQHLREPAGRVR